MLNDSLGFSPLSVLDRAAEKLANDQKQASAVVDWACKMYDAIHNRDAVILVADLYVLQDYAVTGDTWRISRRIAETV